MCSGYVQSKLTNFLIDLVVVTFIDNSSKFIETHDDLTFRDKRGRIYHGNPSFLSLQESRGLDWTDQHNIRLLLDRL